LLNRNEGGKSAISVFFLVAYFLLGLAAVGYSVAMYNSQTVDWGKIPYLRFAFALFFTIGVPCSKNTISSGSSNMFL
jgi:hypothetical protein